MEKQIPGFIVEVRANLAGRSSIRVFCADERGVGTMWSLFWFLLLIGFAGLAVDGTDGLRHRTMLQATADSAALAGTIDLPDASTAVTTAGQYAAANMSPTVHGWVLDDADVVVGRWVPEMNAIDTAHSEPDAVWVTTWRGEENANPIGLSFLRLTGLRMWNVRAQAVAQKYIPECLRDGLIARRHVVISSNNQFVNEICVHGKKGVHMSSNNFYELGVNVSMYDLDTLVVPDSGFESNIGLADALRESGLDPRMVDHTEEIMLAMLDRNPDMSQAEVLPAYVMEPDGTTQPVLDVQPNFDFKTYEAGRIYHVRCDDNETVTFPAKTTIHDVVIIMSGCHAEFDAKVTMYNAVLGVMSTGAFDVTDYNIEVHAQVQFGAPDACAEGGGVQLFSNASMFFNAKTTFDGVQMVATGNISLAAQEMGINGISAQAGIDIPLTSNNVFGLCSGGTPELFTVPYYRLVL